ncbi:MAG TPA: AMP-binding protein [Burkholderiaceae bacterium]
MALLVALPYQIEQARQRTPAFAEILAAVSAASVCTFEALATLPVTRKSELMARQLARRAAADGHDPFGGFSAIGWNGCLRNSGARRVFQSPGGIYEPEGQGSDYWRMGRALFAAGVRAGDLLHNSFSYHLTPAGSMLEGGAHALGCCVFPAGTGNAELQLQALVDLRPRAYAGTPSFLKQLVERAAPPLSIKRALVSGEPFPASLRDWLAEQGVLAYQCLATADLGLIAYETEAHEGLVVDEGVIVEIVRPGTNDPVPEGEVGELVVTTLCADYPLIRFGTGDLTAVLPGPCPTGRTNMRIRGWLGRADQSAKVRGMFVHPGQVAEVLRRFEGLGRARLVIEGEMGSDRMTLKVEAIGPSDGLSARLAEAMRDVTKLRAEVEVMRPGTLPNDGKVIEDLRKLD